MSGETEETGQTTDGMTGGTNAEMLAGETIETIDVTMVAETTEMRGDADRGRGVTRESKMKNHKADRHPKKGEP